MEYDPMNSALLLAVMAQLPLGDPAPAVVFGREQWYQTVKGDEEAFTGTLERIPGAGRNSRNALCLVMGDDGKNNTREVFVGGNNQALLPYLNKRVRITGMSIDIKVDGRMKYEIWPGKIELVGGVPVVGPVVVPVVPVLPVQGRAERILASTNWGVPIGPVIPQVGTGQVQVIARTAEEAQRVLGKQSVEALCKAMGVKEIDWRKEMLIFVSGGVVRGPGSSVDVAIDRTERGLLIRWVLNKKENAAGVPNNPGKILLVRRNDGIIRFEPAAK
jgi:hypothetical protein